jgi:hypothetical protein
VDGLGFDQVVVVQDEDHLVGEVGYLVDQRGQDGLSWWRLGGQKRAQHSLSDVGFNRPQGSDHIGQEAGRVIVSFVEREPGHL